MKTLERVVTRDAVVETSVLVTNPTPVVLLLPPGLLSRTIVQTVYSELFGFCF